MENSEIIEKALHYIRSKYSDKGISVDSVAIQAGFSTDYFNRIFMAHTGFTVMEYVRFTRLRKASLILRKSEKSILDIALECGYDSPEGFARAFKEQYGDSPSDYRNKMRSTEPVYGEFHNETIGARLIHEFKELKMASPDEAIDFLLEKDPIRYGYTAVTIHINGQAVLYDGDDLNDGFVLAGEADGRVEITVASDDYDTVARYCKLFADNRFRITLLTAETDDKLLCELKNRGAKYRLATVKNEAVFKSSGYEMDAIKGTTMRKLTYEDYDAMERYYIEKEGNLANWRKAFLSHIRSKLKREYASAFIFGIFADDHMIGISLGALQSIHGFTLNNCIETSILKEYESEALYRYAFQFVTNAARSFGALPFDDIQCNDGHRKYGDFSSVDLGYEIVMRTYELVM